MGFSTFSDVMACYGSFILYVKYADFCPSPAFISYIFWYVFRHLVDVYPNAANRAVPSEIVGVMLRSTAHVQPAKEKTRRRQKTEMVEASTCPAVSNDHSDHHHLLRCLFLCVLHHDLHRRHVCYCLKLNSEPPSGGCFAYVKLALEYVGSDNIWNGRTHLRR